MLTLLIGVAAIDNSIHLKIMKNVDAVLCDDSDLEKLKNSTNAEFVSRLLNG